MKTTTRELMCVLAAGMAVASACSRCQGSGNVPSTASEVLQALRLDKAPDPRWAVEVSEPSGWHSGWAPDGGNIWSETGVVHRVLVKGTQIQVHLAVFDNPDDAERVLTYSSLSTSVVLRRSMWVPGQTCPATSCWTHAPASLHMRVGCVLYSIRPAPGIAQQASDEVLQEVTLEIAGVLVDRQLKLALPEIISPNPWDFRQGAESSAPAEYRRLLLTHEDLHGLVDAGVTTLSWLRGRSSSDETFEDTAYMQRLLVPGEVGTEIFILYRLFHSEADAALGARAFLAAQKAPFLAYEPGSQLEEMAKQLIREDKAPCPGERCWVVGWAPPYNRLLVQSGSLCVAINHLCEDRAETAVKRTLELANQLVDKYKASTITPAKGVPPT
jgi:hypothetical protein